MIIKQALEIDLARREGIPRLSVMQNDANSRAVEMTLLENGSPWQIPANTAVALGYTKPDGTTGLYDTLPDGTAAWNISGSTVTFVLAPQMLTVPGPVQASVILTRDTVQISTFPLSILVVAAPCSARTKSRDYYHYTTFEAVNRAVGDLNDLATANRASLVAAVNEIAAREAITSVNGVSPDKDGNVQIEVSAEITASDVHLARAVSAYMAEHPVADGFSPTISVRQTDDGAALDIRDANGVTTVSLPKGQDGYTPRKGVDYFDGEPGKTPVRGSDYWTEADQNSIIQQVRQNIGIETVPDYVAAEADAVLDRALRAQGSRTFMFGVITDMHYGSGGYTDGVLHACQGMKHIAERVKLDAVAVLGDYTDEHQMDTETAVADLEEMNALLDRFSGTVNLRLKGNHDHRPGAAAQTYRCITAHSSDVVWGSRIGGYFFRDFPAYKLRIICLNTTEVARDNLSVSDEQYAFFVNALDLAEKDNCAEWGILILSHHPLDWTVTNGAYRFGNILNAYQNGGNWTDGTISCNYAGKNAAVIVCNIHGHLHNLLTDQIYIGEPGNSAQTSVRRMCIPASRVDYVNHYGSVWAEDTWYNKTMYTATDTAFNIVSVDLDSRTVKAFCYGAGYDRELVCHTPAQALNNIIDTVGYTDGARYSASTHATKDQEGYCCTGEIELACGDVLRTRGVNFDSSEYQYCNVAVISRITSNDWTMPTNSTRGDNGEAVGYFSWAIDDANNLTITAEGNIADVVLRLTGYGSGANLIVTKNQAIE